MAGNRLAKPEKNTSPKRWGWTVLIAVCLPLSLLAGGAMGLFYYANQYDGVLSGVSVEGISLSELSEEEAVWKLEQALPALLEDTTVQINLQGEKLASFDLQQLYVSADAEATAALAMRAGRDGDWFNTGMLFLQRLTGVGQDIPAVLSRDEEALRGLVADLASQVDTAPLDASYELTRDGLFATKQLDGFTVDQEALFQLLDAPVPLGESIQLECPAQVTPAAPLDLAAMTAELSGQASNAWYDAETGQVRDGQVGVSLDPAAAAYVLEATAGGERVQLPAQVVYPELTAQELQEVLFRDLLGTATTTVSGSNARRGNVRLAGESVNGTILNDGDIFDYNLVVGERTVERGYGAAATYVNGETVDTIGGGICQVSSTVYKSALLSNLEIVERYAHRFYPGYIDLGMDATVSWGGPEFRFKNNTGYPIRVEAIYEDSTITVNIYGTKTDDTYVKMTREVLSTTGYQTEYVETTDLAPGAQKEKQNGYTGYEVVSYRNIYDGNDNLISSTEEARSSYKNRNQIILVGATPEPPATEPPATEPPATEPPATEPPATEPPATEPPATEPPATEPEDIIPPGWL